MPWVRNRFAEEITTELIVSLLLRLAKSSSVIKSKLTTRRFFREIGKAIVPGTPPLLRRSRTLSVSRGLPLNTHWLSSLEENAAIGISLFRLTQQAPLENKYVPVKPNISWAKFSDRAASSRRSWAAVRRKAPV
jgi:hypothetical protein